MTMFHHSQLPATPLAATMPVTASGVSAANVVATMDVPASHQGSDRPETKNSLTFLPARLVYHNPTTADNTKYAPTISQSSVCIPGSPTSSFGSDVWVYQQHVSRGDRGENRENAASRHTTNSCVLISFV